DLATAAVLDGAHRGDPVAVDGHVAGDRWGAAAVDDGAAPDDEFMHGNAPCDRSPERTKPTLPNRSDPISSAVGRTYRGTHSSEAPSPGRKSTITAPGRERCEAAVAPGKQARTGSVRRTEWRW